MKIAILAVVAAVFLFAPSTAPHVYAREDKALEFVAQTYAPVDRERAAETMVSITLTVKMSSTMCDKPYTISLKWNAIPRAPELMGERSVSELVFWPTFSFPHETNAEFVREFERKAGRSTINLGSQGELYLSFTPSPNAKFSNDDSRLLIFSLHTLLIEGSIRIPFCGK